MSSAAIVAMEAGIYGFVWVTYYNRLLEFPFWRRGNWLMIAVYAVLLIFFEQMYGGFKVGFYKKWNVIYSQILALVIVNVITYLQIALIDKRFHSLRDICGQYRPFLQGEIIHRTGCSLQGPRNK